MGGNVVLTDLPDRLRLLKKNIQTNLHRGNTRGSAIVQELVWGDDLDPDLIEPFPDYGIHLLLFFYLIPFGFVHIHSQTFYLLCSCLVLGSDVIYSEEAVHHLVKTLLQLCGDQTTIFLSGELRNGESLFFSLLLLTILYNKNTVSYFACSCFFFLVQMLFLSIF